MKNTYLFSVCALLAAMVFSNVQAQHNATWVLPQVEIPLKSGADTLAVLKPRFASNSAELVINSNVYRLKISLGGSRCKIYLANDMQKVVAQANQLGRQRGTISFADGKLHEIVRTGRRGNFVYRWQNGSLKIEDGLLSATADADPSSLLTQAALVFKYTMRQYEKEKIVNTSYVPIIVNQ